MKQPFLKILLFVFITTTTTTGVNSNNVTLSSSSSSSSSSSPNLNTNTTSSSSLLNKLINNTITHKYDFDTKLNHLIVDKNSGWVSEI